MTLRAARAQCESRPQMLEVSVRGRRRDGVMRERGTTIAAESLTGKILGAAL